MTMPRHTRSRHVRLTLNTGLTLQAAILEAAPYGLSVTLPARVARHLALGQRVSLEVHWDAEDPPLEMTAFVRDLGELEGCARCELEFDVQGPMSRNLTPEVLRLVFNRRRSERVGIEQYEQPVVRLRGAGGGELVEGWLRDVSTGGVGVRVPLGDVPDLSEPDWVELEFTLPGTAHPLRLEAQFRNCRPQGPYVVLGFEFARAEPGTVDIERDAILAFVSRRLIAVAAS